MAFLALLLEDDFSEEPEVPLELDFERSSPLAFLALLLEDDFSEVLEVPME